jgi:glutamate synthase (NADPH/NADH) large chain
LQDFRYYYASKFWLVKPKAAELATLLDTLLEAA